MEDLAPYIIIKIKEDSNTDNPRAAKFATLSSIVYSYSKARLFN